MSDLNRYVADRSARDPEFAEGFESGYAEFKADVLRQLSEHDITSSNSSGPVRNNDAES